MSSAPLTNQKTSKGFRIFATVAIVVTGVIILTIFGVVSKKHQSADNLSGKNDENDSVEYFVVNATLGPGLKLEAMPWSARLPKDRADEFDVSSDGPVLVRFNGKILDFASGATLTPEATVRSFAFVRGAIAIVTNAKHLAYLSEEGVRDVGLAPMSAARICPSDDGQELLLIRDDEPYGLASVDSGGQVRPLSGSPSHIETVAGTSARHIFSIGNELYLQEGDGPPALLLRLPQKEARILGLALHGDDVYFATREGIYAIKGSLAVPLVLGFGGPLRMTKDGLVILNAKNGRLYRLLTNA